MIVIIAAAVVGGIGSARGAVFGALIVGLVTEVGAAYWDPQLKDVLAFAVLILVLLVRPQGRTEQQVLEPGARVQAGGGDP